MFEPSATPRIFAIPPGADFPAELVAGLLARGKAMAPEDLARTVIYVNTRRMQRRMREIFDAGPARLLPQIRLVTDLGADPATAPILPGPSALRMRLVLTQLIARLLARAPDLAPQAALYDLADSLAALLEEMQAEDVAPEAVLSLDISDKSGHWARSQEFIRIVEAYLRSEDGGGGDNRQRQMLDAITGHWQRYPPTHPVIIAGSTGSRGITRQLMQAVAKLPQGAVVLPGFDFDMTPEVWGRLGDASAAEDHPQYRFYQLASELGLGRDDIQPWQGKTGPIPARNRLLSLALRPAPVTDQWMHEGHNLTGIAQACQDMTLVEAPSPRIEALAIALKMRDCAGQGRKVALITPDRMLTRQVTAALDRWAIEPDDSAGRPLALSAPGRLLRQVADLFGQVLTAEALLALLKHPLIATGQEQRGFHLLWTRELELELRRNGPPFPGAADLTRWAAKGPDDGRQAWAAWLGGLLSTPAQIGARSLTDHLADHLRLTEALAAGPDTPGSGALWQAAAGEAAQQIMGELQREAAHGGTLSPSDYANLIRALLTRGEVHDPLRPHPGVMIWGTLEARVQGADVVILGGLNEGVWPETPKPDPWLNRDMRKQAGLLLPDRRIGLSAHDFQQAVSAQEVWLTRAKRDEEAETVPSRWVNRLTNLLGGLEKPGGALALKQMRARGEVLLDQVARMERCFAPTRPAPRPAPRPPVAARPRRLSVTELATLVRDPYAIYAKHVLRLRPLDPLRQTPDARLRGTVLHKVLEQFVKDRATHAGDRAALLAIAATVLEEEAPWPAARRLWFAKLARVADWFLAGEAARRTMAQPTAFEAKGEARIDTLGFTLSAKADRIDLSPDGHAYIYDYKTGAPSTADQQQYFDRQLLVTAAMVKRGAFADVGPATIGAAQFIGLGSSPRTVDAPLGEIPPRKAWEDLIALVTAYLSPEQGFTARRAMETVRYGGDYDQLARFGEWDITMPPAPEDLT